MRTEQAQPIPTPDEIWVILKENAKLIKEVSASQKTTDRQMKETDRIVKANAREIEATDREIRATAREIKAIARELKKAQNLFTTQWGKLMESLVDGDLIKLLNKRGIKVETTAKNVNCKISYIDEHGDKKEKFREIDIIARDGEEIVVVEVKTTLHTQDVDKFLDTLQDIRQFLPEYKDKKIFGAVAYLQAQDGSGVYAGRQGLFVIRATGSSSSIVNDEDFQAKEFG